MEDAGLLAPQPEQASPWGSRRRAIAYCALLLGAALLAGLAARAGLAGSRIGGGGPGGSRGSANAVALAEVPAFKLRKNRTGCSNFRAMALEKQPATHAGPENCAQRCGRFPGCKGFGYQAHACFEEGQGKWQGACWLWGDECTDEPNECWDDYVLVEPKPLEYHKAGAGKSCSNWKEIGISPKMFKPTEKACASRCAQIRDCTGFAYQPSTCDSPEQKPFDRRACYLMSAECDYMEDACWNYYSMSS